jgi:hypothetical protein
LDLSLISFVFVSAAPRVFSESDAFSEALICVFSAAGNGGFSAFDIGAF